MEGHGAYLNVLPKKVNICELNTPRYGHTLAGILRGQHAGALYKGK